MRTDSANFERLGARGSPHSDDRGFGYIPNKPLGNYQESQVHQSRQYWGPTAAEAQAVAAQPAAPSYAGQATTSYQQPQTQAAAQPSYTTSAPAGYGGYQQPQQTPPVTYGGSVQPVPSPAISSYSSSSGGTHSGQNYIHSSGYGTDSRSSTTYQQPGQESRPRDPRYAAQATAQQYTAPAPRYFGNYRPEFLVYD